MPLVAVFDSETTGLPQLRSQGLFHAVEAAAVVVDTTTGELRHAEPFQVLIWAPDEVLCHPHTQQALTLAGPSLIEEIREWGVSVEEAAALWARWAARHRIEAVAAYNFTFDKNACPWVDQPWLRCLMHWGTGLIKQRDPTYGPLQHEKFGIKQPKAGEMATWLRAQGFRIPEAIPEHRALPDARREACFLVSYMNLDPTGLRMATP